MLSSRLLAMVMLIVSMSLDWTSNWAAFHVKTANASICIIQDVLGMIKSFATARWYETCTDGGFSPDAQIAGGLWGRPHQATVTISILV